MKIWHVLVIAVPRVRQAVLRQHLATAEGAERRALPTAQRCVPGFALARVIVTVPGLVKTYVQGVIRPAQAPVETRYRLLVLTAQRLVQALVPLVVVVADVLELVKDAPLVPEIALGDAPLVPDAPTHAADAEAPVATDVPLVVVVADVVVLAHHLVRDVRVVMTSAREHVSKTAPAVADVARAETRAVRVAPHLAQTRALVPAATAVRHHVVPAVHLAQRLARQTAVRLAPALVLEM